VKQSLGNINIAFQMLRQAKSHQNPLTPHQKRHVKIKASPLACKEYTITK
jgi:hypothetical protein